MTRRLLIACIMALGLTGTAWAQQLSPTNRPATGVYQQPEEYEILGLTVEGVQDEDTRSFVRQTSGLEEGQRVTIPGDQAIAQAIRSIYKLGMFEDVEIVRERTEDDGIFLAIRVEEVPKLASYSFTGIDGGDKEELRREIPLVKRSPVRPGDVERAEQAIRSYYMDEGYLLTEVKTKRTQQGDGTVALKFIVDRGKEAEVENIRITGNEAVSEGDLRGAMENTIEDRWWRFWKSETFNEEEYGNDKQRLIDYYNEKGYYDAHLISDSIRVQREGNEARVVIDLKVHEGPKYHVRNITWRGNTVFPDERLSEALGIEEGEVYNGQKLETNLNANQRGTDVRGLYMNRGYMRFNVQPNIQVVGQDSLDLVFDVHEGDTYEFGDITIAGNTKTKEHVVRRELYTVPGQRFSRDAIQESIRRLSQLEYFSQESLTQGPNVSIDEEQKEVDLTYDLVEQSSDQLELSGTWSRWGLVLMLRFSFNNFSMQNLFNTDAWRPLPSGDGQKLSLSVQTSGTRYQQYSLSFTEPWFRGRPTPIGFSLSYSRFGRSPYATSDSTRNDGQFLSNGSARVFYNRRLKWPDDKFTLSTGVRYQRYNRRNWGRAGDLPPGVSQELTLQESLTRNSLDNPQFPSRGSKVELSLDVAPPLGDFIQYHKWRFDTEWHVPLYNRVSLSFGTDFGYIGSLTGDPLQFQRFVVGGSPFDTQGRYNFSYFGKDIVYMRGYPAGALGPRQGNEPVGGRILNKYTSELSLLAVQSQKLTAQPYLFMDAANTWNGFDTYQPGQLFRSAGVGARVLVPMIGMVELVYGHNFDRFQPLPNGDHGGDRRWYFQFTLGRGFD